MTQETTSQGVVLAELTIDEASVLVGLARTAGMADLATKVQDCIMEASKFPLLHVSKHQLLQPEVLTKVLTEADAQADIDGTPRPDNPTVDLSTQTPASIAATSVIGATSDSEGGEQ